MVEIVLSSTPKSRKRSSKKSTQGETEQCPPVVQKTEEELYGKRVEGQGPVTSNLVIIGEAPGETEIQEGRPFCGKSGELLDRLLGDCGIKRTDVYITNVIKTRPPDNKFSFFRTKENREYYDKSVVALRQEVQARHPNVILCLGAEAQKAILGDSRISARRGFIAWESELNAKVISTYHPAAVLRNINLYPIALFDFQKVARESTSLTYSPTVRIPIVNPDFDTVIRELERLGTSEYISFDIENTSEGIDCISFADSATRAISIPFHTDAGNYWTEEKELYIWQKIRNLLENSKIKKIAQNAFYDMWHLSQMGIQVSNVSHDTMLAAGLINPEFPKDLWFLSSLYTDAPFWEMEDEHKLNIQRWTYNAHDAMVTYEIAEKQRRELTEFGHAEFFSRLPMPLLPCLVRASTRGVRFDVEERGRLVAETKQLLREERRKLKEQTGDVDLNIDSTPQMREYFLTRKGCAPILKRNKNGDRVPSFDGAALDELSIKYPHLKELQIIKQMRYLMTRLDTLQVDLSKDRRIRCSYNVAGTETGRLSSSSAPDRSGMNLQNVTKDLRHLITSDSNSHYLVKADYKQAENILVAYLSGDPNMIRAVSSGEDLHSQIAARIFGCPIQEVSKEQRQLGKKIGHASNYGMRPKRLQEVCWEELGLKVSLKEAKELMLRYFAAFPLIKSWHSSIQSSLSGSRSLSNPFGRRRKFLGFWGDDLFREAYAFLPQGSIADRVNLAIIALDSRGFDIRLQVHDEIVVHCSKDELDATCQAIKEVMEAPFKIGSHSISLTAEIEFGTNWGQTTLWVPSSARRTDGQ